MTTLWDNGIWPLQWGVVICASLVAAGTDIAVRKIPNLLTGPLALGGLAWASYAGGPWGLCDAAASCVLLAAPYAVLFIFAGGGAGDAKLMGAIGTWVGLIGGIVVLVAVSVAGIVLAVLFAVARKRLRTALAGIAIILYGLFFLILGRGKLKARQVFLPSTAEMQTMPYGVAILVGVCMAAAGVSLWRAYA